jgi:hypothetical protein
MLLDGIIQLLQTDAGLTPLVGGRVYENELPRGYTLPAIAVHQYGFEAQDYQFDGPVDISQDQIQLDCYGNTSAEVRAVAQAARTLLEPFTGALPDGTAVQLCEFTRSMAMPFMPHADQKGIANRWLLAFTITTKRV